MSVSEGVILTETLRRPCRDFGGLWGVNLGSCHSISYLVTASRPVVGNDRQDFRGVFKKTLNEPLNVTLTNKRDEEVSPIYKYKVTSLSVPERIPNKGT